MKLIKQRFRNKNELFIYKSSWFHHFNRALALTIRERLRPRPTPNSQDVVVAITVEGQPAPEEDRQAQMATLAYVIAATNPYHLSPQLRGHLGYFLEIDFLVVSDKGE